MLAKPILLAVGSIPNPVYEEVRDIHSTECVSVPSVRGRVMVGKIDGAMAIAKGNASEIPEDEHESPLFVIYIPIVM